MKLTRSLAHKTVLKTDLFEEAFGDDAFFAAAISSDLRRMAPHDEGVDLILYNATLDHFAEPGDFFLALEKLIRVLGPRDG